MFMRVGENIKKYRRNLKLTQEELADKVECHRVNINYYESGRTVPSVKTLVRLADIFQCSLDDLIGRNLEILNESTSENDTKSIRVINLQSEINQ